MESTASVWNPWRVLRAREHLELAWAWLVGCRGRIEETTSDGRRVITLRADLNRRERSEVLTHELIHDEWDWLWPVGTPLPIIEKGELLVERETARRCIPVGALQTFVIRRIASELPVSPLDVAEEFDVSEELAELALTLLPSCLVLDQLNQTGERRRIA